VPTSTTAAKARIFPRVLLLVSLTNAVRTDPLSGESLSALPCTRLAARDGAA
jgi:hypothetical protein